MPDQAIHEIIEQLNEAAEPVYRAGYAAGLRAGIEEEADRSGLYFGRVLLEFADRFLESALATPRDELQRIRQFAQLAYTALSCTPGNRFDHRALDRVRDALQPALHTNIGHLEAALAIVKQDREALS